MRESLDSPPPRKDRLRGKAPEPFLNFIEPFGKGDYANAYLGRLRLLHPTSTMSIENVKGYIQTMPTYTEYWENLIRTYNSLEENPPLPLIEANQISSLVADIIEPEISDAKNLDTLALEVRALAVTDTFSRQNALTDFKEITRKAYTIIYKEPKEQNMVLEDLDSD